ncbi:MAG: metallophosphoesterase [Deltaproteobacteria bacterium]|nr:metallophosphoesterase [Deltaproteobacteria bacterium]
MSLFLLTFFLVYGGVHAYAFQKARTALGFGWGTSTAVILVLAALCCGPLIVHYLGEHKLETAAKAASWLGYTWMGLLFFFTWMNLAIDALNLLVRLAGAVSSRGASAAITYGKAPFLALAGLSVALGAYSFFEASHPRIEHIRIRTDKLPAGTNRLRIAQISDVHLGLIVRHDRANAIASAVRKANPDLFVSTGDLVDGRINHLDGLSEIFREIRPPLGKYAVTGNHEFYAGIGQALDFTRRAGFTVLRGETVTVGNVLRIAGVDDPVGRAFGRTSERGEKELLGAAPSPLFTILLKHRPFLSNVTHRMFDLQLSGHTHNGQIFPFRLLVRFWYPLLAGLYTPGDGGALYISRGTGTWGPPMRFLSPPEVTIIDIIGRGHSSPLVGDTPQRGT